ncbi:MAG: chromosome segregation protein SMC [Butyrivibrio sp.]|nr:chromosome segregation protein SMC [Butyrivibrio sp.]
MYLKKIDVQGFKSFANKMVFEFDNGITGIVGPNGSGKSNIADAVRWVLGEQSAKQLRGSRMEDIIFAGTEARKPVSFAAVSLTIDNTDHKLDIDYDEVTVTRRVFRSGESEYMLNGNSCRLKDINELFYDTGIGKEGYSIIGQGQIDRILNGRPEERRELFDEAAGIVKYKRRKAAAQKSLDNEKNNLVRISDILAELEKQVGPLSVQAEKAREYLRLKESLKTCEVNLFLAEAESLAKGIKETSDKLAIVEGDMSATQEEFDRIKTVYDEKEAEISEASSRIDELSAVHSQSEIDKNKLIGHIALLKEQIKTANLSDEHLAQRIAAIDEQISERDEEKAALIKQKFSMDDEIESAGAKRDAADSALASLNEEINSVSAEIEEKKNSIFENLNQKGIIRTNIQRYETMLEQIGIRRAEINGRLIGYKTDESRFDSSLGESRDELERINAEIRELVARNNRLGTECGELKKRRAALEEKLTLAKEQNMRVSSRLETLRNIAERYDGYGNSIRKVMECRENGGVLGVVADIIKTDKKYETAIETALGGTIQNIVTDTEDTAKKMIAYLKENKYGRATFLPLSAVDGRNARREQLDGESGFIGYASELVSAEDKYLGVAAHLLGRCVVTDNIDSALRLSRKYRHALKIVTLEGELLNPGGAMTGGAFKNTGNLLGRRREIEELRETLDKTAEAVAKITSDMEKTSARIAQTESEASENSELIQAKRLEQNTAELEYNRLASKQDEIRTVYEDNKRESEEIEKQVLEINESLSSLKYELSGMESYNEETTSDVEQLTKRLERLKGELADRSRVAEEARIEFSEISQKGSFIEESIKRALREIGRLKESISELEDSRTDSTKEIEAKNKEIAEITELIKTADIQIADYARELEELRKHRDELSESVKTFFTSREECQARLVELEKENYRLSQNMERLEGARDSRIDYMWNEYEITLSQAAQLKDDSFTDEAEMKKAAGELKNSIRRLGDVNVNAIEDYREVSERYEFLKGQHDDLINARDKLISVIEELDTDMRARFSEKFEEIKAEFAEVFKQLFGGGKGTIELDGEEDILEADISVISQPPGKKLQNMMQLSGGEKALTAICLLFAIQNLKPSPFCLLDEIEAALDDSNVERFAKYLHNLTKNTQFIVITHRRGTMASADRLYGITMQEKGVSALVSVDLIENQLDGDDKKQN